MSLFKQITDTITRAVRAAAESRSTMQTEQKELRPVNPFTGEDWDAETERVKKEWSERREMEERQRRERQQPIDPYAQQVVSALGVEAIQRKHEAEREAFEKRVAEMRKGGLP